MPFRSDRQRKGFFGKNSNSSNSDNPQFNRADSDPATKKFTGSRLQRVDDSSVETFRKKRQFVGKPFNTVTTEVTKKDVRSKKTFNDYLKRNNIEEDPRFNSDYKTIKDKFKPMKPIR